MKTPPSPPWEETEDNIPGKPDDGSSEAEAGDPVDSGYSAYPVPGAVFFHPDYTGNIAYTTDSYGDVTSINYFKPYGERWQLEDRTGDGTGNSYHAKFNQKSFNEETGLSHFGFRFYDPEIGRFIQPDTMIADKYDTQGLNPYSFCAGSPINFQDPTGNFLVAALVVAIACIAVGAIAGVAYGAVTGDWDTALKVGVGVAAGMAGGILMGGVLLPALAASWPQVYSVYTIGGMIAGGPIGLPATLLVYGCGVANASGTALVMGALTGAVCGGITGLNKKNDHWLEVIFSSFMMGSYGSLNPVYWAYTARVIYYNVASCGQVNNSENHKDFVYGKKMYNKDHDRYMRSRVWFPGEPHVTGKGGSDNDYGSFGGLVLITLDTLGLHGTSVRHDHGTEFGYYNDTSDPEWKQAGGMVSAFGTDYLSFP